jgi:hypothetical protein
MSERQKARCKETGAMEKRGIEEDKEAAEEEQEEEEDQKRKQGKRPNDTNQIRARDVRRN